MSIPAVVVSDEELFAEAARAEADADHAEARAGSPARWRAADTYYELSNRGYTQREIAARVGKGASHINYCIQAVSVHLGEHDRPIFQLAYRQAQGKTVAPSVVPTAPLPEGVFRTIVADPPWQYANKATRGAAEDHYDTMSIEELCALDVPSRAADQAHLYLWTTNGFLREAFSVLDAWDFTYKTTLVWCKPQLGMGNYFRSSTEYVLFGIRGGLRTLDCNQRNWFEAPRKKHSAKPEGFFGLVEQVSPGPYLEMFARRRRIGWDTWGNEA